MELLQVCYRNLWHLHTYSYLQVLWEIPEFADVIMGVSKTTPKINLYLAAYYWPDLDEECMYASNKRTLDNPHKCLFLNFPKTPPHFCPRKIFKIWAFLTKMTPDFLAGSPYLTKHGSNLRLITILEFALGQI